MINPSRLYSARDGRRFALTLASAFAVIALIVWWRDRETPAVILGALAAVLAIAGLTIPSKLQPVDRAWMSLAHALSRITTPLFMGIVYFVVLAPVGVIRRLAGRNSLVHKLVNDSYWIARPRVDGEPSRRRMERQF